MSRCGECGHDPRAEVDGLEAELERLRAALVKLDGLVESTHGMMPFAELWSVMVEDAGDIVHEALNPGGETP